MSDQLLTLPEWDRRRYSPPHPITTLRKWVREGKIYPKPERVGREYRVQENAIFVTSQHIDQIYVVESKDPIVNAIISGQTQKRGQA